MTWINQGLFQSSFLWAEIYLMALDAGGGGAVAPWSRIVAWSCQVTSRSRRRCWWMLLHDLSAAPVPSPVGVSPSGRNLHRRRNKGCSQIAKLPSPVLPLENLEITKEEALADEKMAPTIGIAPGSRYPLSPALVMPLPWDINLGWKIWRRYCWSLFRRSPCYLMRPSG